MNYLRTLCILFSLFSVSFGVSISIPNNPELKVFSVRTLDNIPPQWKILKETVPPEAVLSFRVLLRQQNLEKLEKLFWQVSDPQSPSWRQFLKLEQIKEIVSPSESIHALVKQWLSSSGIQENVMKSTGDAIIVRRASIAQLQNLFPFSEFRFFTNSKSGKRLIRHIGFLSVPYDIARHIDFISGLSELIDGSTLKFKAYNKGKIDETVSDVYVIPQVLRDFYGIFKNSSVNKGSQSVVAFDGYYSQGALQAFASYFNITPGTIENLGSPNCLQEGCIQEESDLDIQYLTSIGSNISSYFWENAGNNWILEWAMDVVASSNPPLIHSISYGINELLQCLIENCTSYGYNSEQYTLRSNVEFQKMGLLGLTIFAASGDDGATGARHSLGLCPLDSVDHYCPFGGCTYSSSACGGLELFLSFEIPGTNFNICVIPSSGICSAFLNITELVNVAANANPNCDIQLDYDVRLNPHLHSTCVCSTIKSSVYLWEGAPVNITGYTNYNIPSLFDSVFPASSPYVVAVGATQFTGNSPNFGEIACSILNGSAINSGGGFSQFTTMPSYQVNAVKAYLDSGVALPPEGSYNASNRAYPDIALNGHNVIIVGSNNSADPSSCPCYFELVDGTSASTPAVAGMFSLINEVLLGSGQPPLGFLNPALYEMASSSPSAFHDIVEGENNCAGNSGSCCLYGYRATDGWDPVTGLGTPNYPVILEYFLKKTPVSTTTGGTSSAYILQSYQWFIFFSALIATFAVIH